MSPKKLTLYDRTKVGNVESRGRKGKKARKRYSSENQLKKGKNTNKKELEILD